MHVVWLLTLEKFWEDPYHDWRVTYSVDRISVKIISEIKRTLLLKNTMYLLIWIWSKNYLSLYAN